MTTTAPESLRGRGRGRGRGFGTIRGTSQIEPPQPPNRVPATSVRPQSYSHHVPNVPIPKTTTTGSSLSHREHNTLVPGIDLQSAQARRQTAARSQFSPSSNDHANGFGSDRPYFPPRSPPISPKRENLPLLPPRAHHSQPRLSVGPSNSDSPDSEKQGDMRQKCVEELYQTEADYINDLETLSEVFIFPLRTVANLDEQNINRIFSNLEVLINCNKEFLRQLETNRIDASDTVGEVFLKFAEYFKMYKGYCANQQISTSTVHLLMKKHSGFRKNLEVSHKDPRCRGLFLQSFLIKPIQRVCKYPLLLRELIKFTPEDHSDYEPLQQAYAKINHVVSEINEAQRQAEGLKRISDLQALIDGCNTLVAAGRYFVKEGDLWFYKNAKSKNREKRTVFFFYRFDASDES